jgi:hypothetical protein
MIKAAQTNQPSPTSHIEQLSVEDVKIYRSITPTTTLQPFLNYAEKFKTNNDYKSALLFFERLFQVTGSKHILLEVAHCKEVLGDIASADEQYTYVANKARGYESAGQTRRAHSLFSKLYQYTGEEVYFLDRDYLSDRISEQRPSVIGNSMFKPVSIEENELELFPRHSASYE